MNQNEIGAWLLVLVAMTITIGPGLPARLLADPSTDDLILWLDANDANTLTLDTVGTTTVQQWDNKAAADSVANAAKAGQPQLVAGPNGTNVLQFDGADDVLRNLAFSPTTAQELTVFIVTAPTSNPGNFRAFFAARPTSGNDFQLGLNIDMQGASSATFNMLNVEGAKGGGGGGVDLMTDSFAFGTYHIIQVDYLDSGAQLWIDGAAQNSRSSSSNPVGMEEIRVGARIFSNTEQGYLPGSIGAVLVYDRELTDSEANQTGHYLGEVFGIANAYVVPEPGSLMMLGGVLAAAGVRRRRR